METNLLDRMLDAYLSGQTPVTLTLRNKIRVSGKIKAFDSYVIVLEGQKQEIVYRHAVSNIFLSVISEQKRRPLTGKPALLKAIPSTTPKPAPQKSRSTHPQALSAAPAVKETQGLTNTMKDGLLKWMQEQKAAK
jgi:RNA chaperone Hfq